MKSVTISDLEKKRYGNTATKEQGRDEREELRVQMV